MEALGINLGYLLVQIFNFLILFVVLRAWVFRPVMNLLETRRERIAQGLEDARVAAEARANAEKEAEKILAEAQQEANRRVREATERAEQAAREIRAEAEREAAQIRENALAEAEQAKQEALAELRGQVAELAIAAARKVVGEAVDESRHRAIVEEFFTGLENGRLALLEGADLSGEKAEVVTALPLTEQEKQRYQEQLRARLGDNLQVEFRVDPAILGGVIVRVGDRIVDGSAAGKLEGLRQRLR